MLKEKPEYEFLKELIEDIPDLDKNPPKKTNKRKSKKKDQFIVPDNFEERNLPEKKHSEVKEIQNNKNFDIDYNQTPNRKYREENLGKRDFIVESLVSDEKNGKLGQMSQYPDRVEMGFNMDQRVIKGNVNHNFKRLKNN